MRFAFHVSFACLACAPRPATSTEAITPPVAPTRARYEPPPAVSAPPAQITCVEEQGRALFIEDGHGLEFTEPIRLTPATWGARASDQAPSEGVARTREDLFDTLHRYQRPMLACHRWAQHGRAPERRRVLADFVVDPFGRVAEARATGGGAELDQCVTRVLRSMRVNVRTPRQTHATLRLHFAPLHTKGEPAPRPREIVPYLPALCLRHPPGSIPSDELVVDERDFITFGKPRPEGERRHVIACPPETPPVIAENVLRAVHGHRGAFNACVADAPSTTTITARFEVAPSGSLGDVTLDGAKPALSVCLRRALEAVRVPHMPARGSVVAKLSFAVSATIPSWPKEPRLRGEAMLDAGHGAGAVEAFAEVVRRNAPGDACWGRLGVLRAELVQAPWIDDPRVWAALEDFVDAHPRLVEDEPTEACLEAAAPVVTEVALWPFVIASVGPWVRVGRFRSAVAGHAVIDPTIARAKRLLDRAPQLPGAFAIRELLVTASLLWHPSPATIDEASHLIPRLPKEAAHFLERLRDHVSTRGGARWTEAEGQAWLSPTCPVF